MWLLKICTQLSQELQELETANPFKIAIQNILANVVNSAVTIVALRNYQEMYQTPLSVQKIRRTNRRRISRQRKRHPQRSAAVRRRYVGDICIENDTC